MPDTDPTPTVPPTPAPPPLVNTLEQEVEAFVQSRVQRFLGTAPHWLLAVIMTLVGVGFTAGYTLLNKWLFNSAPAPVVQPAADATAGGADRPGPMGWVDDPDAVKAVQATCPHPVFSMTPAAHDPAAVPDNVFQWDWGKQANCFQGPHNQLNVGSCTSFGDCGAVRYQITLLIVQALKAGQPPPAFQDLAEEVTYGIERVDVLHGQIHGDGGTGAAAAQAGRDFGVCPRGRYGSEDLTTYSEATCRKYGNKGVPAVVKAEAAKHKVKSISLVTDTADLRKGMANGFTASVASNVGFGSEGPYVRDKDGVLKARGTWAHEMFVIGYTRHGTRGYLYCIQNSWGPKWVSGPKGAGDPPDGSFWVTEATMQKMLDAHDSWFHDGVGGFEPKKLDWAQAPAPRPDRGGLLALNPFRGLPCVLSADFSLSP